MRMRPSETFRLSFVPTLPAGGMIDPVDGSLIERTLSGDEVAFAELVKRYKGSVWSTVRRFLGHSPEAEDAFQEVLIRTYVSLGRFDLRYPFHPWVKRIATNYCIDELRRRKANRLRFWSDFGECEQERLMNKMTTASEFDLLNEGNVKQYERIALTIVHRLKPKSRSALIMRELEGSDYSDISQSLGISEASARARVCRARAEVLKQFRNHLSTMAAR